MESFLSARALNVPNLLTLLRIALLPAVVWRYLMGDARGALVVYLISMLTDLLDGALARRLNQITPLGKLLDPLADKLSLLTLLALFVYDGQIPLWLLELVVFKELILIAGSVLALRYGIVVSALPIGKVTTAAFVASMALRFAGVRRVSDVLLSASVALSLVSLAWYSAALLRRLSQGRAPSKAE